MRLVGSKGKARANTRAGMSWMMVLPSRWCEDATCTGERRQRIGKEKGDWNHGDAYEETLKLHSYSRYLLEFSPSD